MSDKLGILANEGNPANKGIIIAAILILAGIFPNIKVWQIEITIPLDSWLLILVGLSVLFYFFSMKVNQNEYVDDKNRIWISMPVFRSKLSQECFNISIIALVLFILRGGFLFIKFMITA